MSALASPLTTVVPLSVYVEKRREARLNNTASSGGVVRTVEGSWRIAGTRVSLDSVIHAHKIGHSPEMIVTEFPSVSVMQVRGAIAFYESRKEDIDQYLVEQDARWRLFQETCQSRQDPLLQRMRDRAVARS